MSQATTSGPGPTARPQPLGAVLVLVDCRVKAASVASSWLNLLSNSSSAPNERTVMERDLAGATLSVQQFGRLAAACRYDSKFPKTYLDWSSLVAHGTRVALAEGAQVDDIVIDVDEFFAWCHRVEVVACLDAVRAYLILIRRAQHVPGADNESTDPTLPGASAGNSMGARGTCRRNASVSQEPLATKTIWDVQRFKRTVSRTFL